MRAEPEAPRTGRSDLTAILAALPEELSPLLRRVSGLRAIENGAGRLFSGRLGGRRVVLKATGMGRKNARWGARTLLEAVAPSEVIGLGLAGGVSPGLEKGEILAAGQIRDLSGTISLPDPSWLRRAAEVGGARVATLVTTDAVVWNRAEKKALLDDIATKGPAAVDMESAAWASVSLLHGLPYLILRSVFDRAEDELPSFLTRCQDEQGGVSRGKVLRHALLRPRIVPELLSMRRQARVCAERLAALVERLLVSAGGGGEVTELPGGSDVPNVGVR
jgi:adenosylhomocysteine nucleosidase